MILNIEKFYKRELLEVMLFGYVNALRFNLPTASIENAIKNFMKHHAIDDDVMNMETAKKVYQRMQSEYIDSQKSSQ